MGNKSHKKVFAHVRKGLRTIVVGVMAMFLVVPGSVLATTQSFTQNDWSGGVDGGTAASQTGWTQYTSKDSSVLVNGSGYLTTDTASPSGGSVTLTSDSDFNTGTVSSTQVSGGSVILDTIPQNNIATGLQFTVFLETDGSVWTWGDNSSGQLGNDTTTNSSTPIKVSGIDSAIAVAAGYSHTLALKSDGTVWAWGDNTLGQFGNGTTNSSLTPIQVPSLSNVVAIAAGAYFSLALKSDGTVWAWGKNNHGQLGDGSTTDSTSPVQVSGITTAVAIAAGYYHSLALLSDGTVQAWGYNNPGQLGDGTTTESHIPVQVSGLSGVAMIAAGGNHSMALKPDGTVWAWGYNNSGQLGDGTTTDSSVPVQVSGITTAVAIAAGYFHSMAVLSDGTASSWGYNNSGQLGDGTTNDSLTPVQVSGITGGGVIAGSSHTALIKQDGTVWAWGYNNSGQLGDGTTTDSSVPVQVLGFTGATVIAGGYNHSLLVQPDGTAWGWGNDLYGQVGNDTTGLSVKTPTQVVTFSGFTGVKFVGAGYNHSLGIKSDGTLWAWGQNGYGQIGDGTTSTRVLPPTQIAGLSNIIDTAGGYAHSVALDASGNVYSWGLNNHGQLGDGTTTNNPTPTQVPGLSNITAVAAGQYFSLALDSSGHVWAWGVNNRGQLGNNTTTESHSPMQVLDSSGTGNLSAITAIAAGSDFSVALSSAGGVYVWGNGGSGQWGNGSTGSVRKLPALAGGGTLSNVTGVSAGYAHVLAVSSDGTAWGWGLDTSSQLGDGSTGNKTLPVQVSQSTGMGSVLYMKAGQYHSFALTTDGTAWGWGNNVYGQIGDGTTASRTKPRKILNVISTNVYSDHYVASGVYTSAPISLTGNDGLTTASYTTQTPSGTGITVSIRVGDTATPDGTWTGWQTITSGQNISALGAPKYVQFKADLTTSDNLVTAALDDITFNYDTSSSYTLISSAFDTGRRAAILDSISMTGTIPGSTDIQVQVRASSTQAGLIDAPWCGYTACDGVDTFSLSAGQSDLQLALGHTLQSDEGGHEWMQYKVILVPTTTDVATLDSISLNYEGDGSIPAKNTAAGWFKLHGSDNGTGSCGVGETQLGIDVKDNASGASILTNRTVLAVYDNNDNFVSATEINSSSDTICFNPNTEWVQVGIDAGPHYYNGSPTSVTLNSTPVNLFGNYSVDPATAEQSVTAYVYLLPTSAAHAYTLSLTDPKYPLTSKTTPPFSIDTQEFPTGASAMSSLAVNSWQENAPPVYGTIGGTTQTGSAVISGGAGAYTTTPAGVDLTTQGYYLWSGSSLLEGDTIASAFALLDQADPFTIDLTDPTITNTFSNSASDPGKPTKDMPVTFNMTLTDPFSTYPSIAPTLSSFTYDGVDETSSAVCAPVMSSAQPLTGVTGISSGSEHALALKSDGTVWAWGKNNLGQLGDGTTTSSAYAQQIPGLVGVVGVAGGDYYSLALKSDGTVWAWGKNNLGQLGDGTTSDNITPSKVPGLTNVAAIAAGSGNALALKSDGTVWAWGIFPGDGSSEVHSPVQVTDLGNDNNKIAISGSDSFVIKNDGTVRGWGYNIYGNVGDGTTVNPRLSPVNVVGLTNVVDVQGGTVGGYATLAVKSDGTAWGWGYNGTYGLIGDGTTVNRATPVQVVGEGGVGYLSGITAVTTNTTSQALASDGSIWSWGYNFNGTYGDGTTSSSLTPVHNTVFTGVSKIAQGSDDGYYVKSDQTVWASGWNARGTIGDGTTIDRATPVQVQTAPVPVGDSITCTYTTSQLTPGQHTYHIETADDAGNTTATDGTFTIPDANSITKSGAYRGQAFSIDTSSATNGFTGTTMITDLSQDAGVYSVSTTTASMISYTNISSGSTPGTDTFVYTITDSDGEGQATSTVTVNYGYCGDVTLQAGHENCEGSNLNGYSCSTIGYQSGTLSCNPTSCLFDASQCVLDTSTGFEGTGDTECSDGTDNDRDGFVDVDDPGCWADINDSASYDPSINSENNWCGNGTCDTVAGETPLICPQDCALNIREGN